MSIRSELRRLGDIAEVASGGTPLRSVEEFWNGEIAWYSSGELNDVYTVAPARTITNAGLQGSNAKLFPKGSLLIGMYDTAALKMSILDRDAAFNQAIAGVKPNSRIDLRFVMEGINAVKPILLEERRGVRQKNLSLEKIKNIALTLPPLEEQKRIVAILDEAFEGLDRAAANAKKNLANARELFDSHLNAILTRRGPGWSEQTLGKIAHFKNGLNFTKSSKGEIINIVGVKDFQKNFWVPMELLETARIEGTLSAGYLLQKNDILTVRSNGNKQLIGRCILAGEVREKTSHSGFTIRIRVRSPDITPAYLVHYLKSAPIRHALIESGDGANISSLNQQALSTLPVAFPSVSEQGNIINSIEAIEQEAVRLELIYRKKITGLAELKQSIFQKAFAGELTAALDLAA